MKTGRSISSVYCKELLFVILLGIAVITSIIEVKAQNVTAYTDYRGYFHAFDNGSFKQLDYLPVKSYKLGRSSVAYIDNKNDFRIYYKGQSIYQ